MMMRENSKVKNCFYIFFSFVCAIVLTIAPIPEKFLLWRPLWVVLVLLYWLIALPEYIGMFSAFIIGILMDGFSGDLMGLKAFLMVGLAYFILKNHHKIHTAPLWQQTLLIPVIIFLYLSLQFWLLHMMGLIDTFNFNYLSPVLTCTVIWPFLVFFLNRFQYRFRIS